MQDENGGMDSFTGGESRESTNKELFLWSYRKINTYFKFVDMVGSPLHNVPEEVFTNKIKIHNVFYSLGSIS